METELKAVHGWMPDGLRRLGETVLQTVFPPRCIACGEAVGSDFGLCGPCWRETAFLTGLVCDCCGAPLPGEDSGAVLCDECLSAPRPWAQGRAAFLYAGTGRRLVLAFKHADRLDLARPLGRFLHRAALPILRPGMLLAPVPLHRFRLVKRQYNQSALLARELARLAHLPHQPDLFTRTRATPSQEGLSREERQRNLAGAIAVAPKHRGKIAGRHVLIVDDVLTSGATLGAAAEAALAAGAAQVSVLALARVAKEV